MTSQSAVAGMVVFLVIFYGIDVNSQKLVSKAEGDCKIVDKRVCDGTVAKVRDDGMEIVCVQGKFQAMKGRRKRAAPVVDCEWYGQVYCDGDVVEDLFIWKHQVRCVGGKMYIHHRTWHEVEKDPRFQELGRNVV